MSRYDVLVVGSGLAGLYGALLASRHGSVLVLTKARLEDCNTYYAQGGIAAALASTDSPDIHFRDTMAAGAGLCDPRAVRILVDEGPARVRDLVELGVQFDRVGSQIAFTREGAHSQPRVLHAGGDATGANIESTIVRQVRSSPRVTLLEDHIVCDLVRDSGRVLGVRAIDGKTGQIQEYRAAAVILATGGAGQLFLQTTNPEVATGDGIALAFDAGAEIADMEFVQFHPTALAVPGAPRFLISEAVRGEGGLLRNVKGERFMLNVDPRAELAPRDIVARAIVLEAQRTGHPCCYLDVRHLGTSQFRRRFPTISQVCQEYGIDPGRDLIPVAPAAHYLMGGIRTNVWGETSLAGLYASGECACTGAHGANRLASNSLLETIVFSARIVERLVGGAGAPDTRPSSEGTEPPGLLPDLHLAVPAPRPGPAPVQSIGTLRELTWSLAGLTRDSTGLAKLEAVASAWQAQGLSREDRSSLELWSLTCLARLVALAALRREESRGAHYRSDYPRSDPNWQRRIVMVSEERLGVQGSGQIRASTGRG